MLINNSFPESSGNDFQGLNTQFPFLFTAEEQRNSNAIASAHIKGIIGSEEVLKTGILDLSPTTINNLKFFLVAGLTIGIGGGLFVLNRRRIYSWKE